MEKGEWINGYRVVYLYYGSNSLFYHMKKLVLLITALSYIHFLTAQEMTKKDSLRNDIRTATTDSLRIEAMYEYMRATLNDNTSDFEPYLKEMVHLSKKIKFKWGLSTAYILSLSYYKNTGSYELALKYADSVETLLKNDTASDLVLNIGHMHTNRGNLYYNIGDYQKALDDYFPAEKILREQKFKTLASIYSSIANCFSNLSNPQKALEFSDMAINTARQFDDKRLLATTLMNKSTTLMDDGNFKSADSILNIAWPIVEKLQNTKSLFVYCYNKGDIEAYYKKDTLNALKYYHQSYNYARENQDVWQITRALVSLAQFKIDIKQKDAIKLIDELYAIADSNEMKDSKADALELYSEWHAQNGNYKRAYEYQQLHNELSDSINSEESREKISMLEVRFRVENKEQEIRQLKIQDKINQLTIGQKNTLNYILIGSAASLLIIFSLAYRNYRHKQKLQQRKISELETEKQLTATEAVLKGEEQERTRLAKDLHDGLGGMLSGIKHSFHTMKGNLIMTPDNAQAFERSMDMLDSSIKEMRRVAHNMMPEALVKFGLDTALKDFSRDINQTGALTVRYQSIGLENAAIEQTAAITIFRIIQELINNTMKHAGAKTAVVQVTKNNENISITVEDDGKGFDPVILKNRTGIGWSNIQSRVEYLKGKLDVRSEPGKGTSVLIEFIS